MRTLLESVLFQVGRDMKAISQSLIVSAYWYVAFVLVRICTARLGLRASWIERAIACMLTSLST